MIPYSQYYGGFPYQQQQEPLLRGYNYPGVLGIQGRKFQKLSSLTGIPQYGQPGMIAPWQQQRTYQRPMPGYRPGFGRAISSHQAAQPQNGQLPTNAVSPWMQYQPQQYQPQQQYALDFRPQMFQYGYQQ